MKDKPIYQGADSRECVYSAISVLRLALGYETNFPEDVDRPDITYIDWIAGNSGKFFPKHAVATFGPRVASVAYNYLGEWPTLAHAGGNGSGALWMFDYSTLDQRQLYEASGRFWQTHTVVGFPHLHQGMFGLYAIKIWI